jgi:hypothetical protein
MSDKILMSGCQPSPRALHIGVPMYREESRSGLRCL